MNQRRIGHVGAADPGGGTGGQGVAPQVAVKQFLEQRVHVPVFEGVHGFVPDIGHRTFVHVIGIRLPVVGFQPVHGGLEFRPPIVTGIDGDPFLLAEQRLEGFKPGLACGDIQASGARCEKHHFAKHLGCLPGDIAVFLQERCRTRHENQDVVRRVPLHGDTGRYTKMQR